MGSFVAELYDRPSLLEREAAFLVVGLEQPCHTLEDLEDQLGDRIQPLSTGVRMALRNEALADLCSRIQWQFTPGLYPAFSAVAALSDEALQSYHLLSFEPDEWGRLRCVRPFYGRQLECFREEDATQTQYRFVATLSAQAQEC